jgi:ABC-type Mn2+/Zn2+ transport system ATPase subunit
VIDIIIPFLHGIQLSLLTTAANTHDIKSATKTFDNIEIIKRRIARILASRKTLQNLRFDKRYDSQEIEYEAVKREYISQIRHSKEETQLTMTKKHNNH